MPRLSAWFIRAALAHLALGLTFGSMLLANKGVPLHPAIWRLLPAHVELVLLGWTLQLGMGVAYWILPRFLSGPRRGNERSVWLAFVLLNGGVLLAGLAVPFGLPTVLILAGRVAEGAAALIFFINAWPRIKPLGA
jgi:hypothetical protein